MPEISDQMNDETGYETNDTLNDATGLAKVGDELNDDFRGVLAGVVDGGAWARYAGPGASVRRRGQRRRRRVAATSVAGVAAVAVVAVAAGAGMAGGKSAPGPGAVTTGQSTEAGHGRYVKLTDALMQPADLGTGFKTVATTSEGSQFWGVSCSRIAPIATAGSAVNRGFDGSGANPFPAGELLYQFADASSARAAFTQARTAAQAAGCRSVPGTASSVQDVGGVGDAMFVQDQQQSDGSPFIASAAVLQGQVIIVDYVMPGSGKAMTDPGGWLTAVSRKAVTRLRSAPRTDVPEVVPEPTPITPPTGGPTNGGSAQSSLPASQPVDGCLFAPADLGTSFTASAQDAWRQGQISTATTVAGMMFRGSVSGGDGEFLVNEGVYSFPDASAAQSGLAAYEKSTTQTKAAAQPLSGLGDRAWIKRWTGQQGGLTVAIQAGAKVITFDVLAGGTSADQPIPGGDSWVQQIAQKAVQRLAGAK